LGLEFPQKINKEREFFVGEDVLALSFLNTTVEPRVKKELKEGIVVVEGFDMTGFEEAESVGVRGGRETGILEVDGFFGEKGVFGDVLEVS
jgi:hypothetical protein